jgi:hypothetical protein
MCLISSGEEVRFSPFASRNQSELVGPPATALVINQTSSHILMHNGDKKADSRIKKVSVLTSCPSQLALPALNDSDEQKTTAKWFHIPDMPSYGVDQLKETRLKRLRPPLFDSLFTLARSIPTTNSCQ